MLNRRIDVIYFAILLAAALIGYFASNSTTDEVVIADVSGFETPQLTLEAPFEFPYAVPSFANRQAPMLQISDNLESMLVEVRSALLKSASPVEVPVEVERTRQLASTVD